MVHLTLARAGHLRPPVDNDKTLGDGPVPLSFQDLLRPDAQS